MLDAVIVIVNRDRPDLVKQQIPNLHKFSGDAKFETCVVEMGSENVSEHKTIWYSDPAFRGKAFGHNVGLRFCELQYQWQPRAWIFLMNDLLFETCWRPLVDTLHAFPSVGVLSPTQPGAGYPKCQPESHLEPFHVVTTCDYLCLAMRPQDCREIGFLNPAFQYCWGAIHELSYLMGRAGKSVAYHDHVHMKHLGGTTYGQVASVCSRVDYVARAKDFAANYFAVNYGSDWDRLFYEAMPVKPECNTFSMHKRFWGEPKLTPADEPIG